MKFSDINLRIVYETLETILGKYSFILTDLIKTVVKVSKIDTNSRYIQSLAINGKGDLFISEEFCEENIENNSSLAVLLLHEIFHPILGDTGELLIPSKDDPERGLKLLAQNVAMDSRINAFLGILYKYMGAKDVFRDLYLNIEKKRKEKYIEAKGGEEGYEEEILYKLLYSDKDNAAQISKIISADAANYYVDFYSNGKPSSFSDLYIEVLNYLRKNKDKYGGETIVILIGNHNESEVSEENKVEIPKEKLEEIKKRISEAIRNNIEKKGQSNETDLLITYVDKIDGYENSKLSSALIKKLAVRSITNNILVGARRKVGKYSRSPIMPNKFGKSDVIRMAAKMPILLWNTKKYVSKFDPRLVPIYFDVSGSMDSFIPKILDLILNMDERIQHIWCFSDYIEEHTIEQLTKREIRSSGGTNFDIVIEHAVNNDFRDILVITDGHCIVRNHPKAHPQINSVCTILVDAGTDNNWFSKNYGNTHKLEEVITE